METEYTDQATEDGIIADRDIGGHIRMADNGRNECGPESSIDRSDQELREQRMAVEKDPVNEGTSNDTERIDAAQGGNRETDVFLPGRGTFGPYVMARKENRENETKEMMMKKAGIDIDYFDRELKGADLIRRELKYMNKKY